MFPDHFVTIYRDKSKADPVVLGYEEKTLGRAQARLRDRTTLTPLIDLDAYQCRSLVDWVDVRVSLTNTSQFRWVNERIIALGSRKCFVKPHEAGAGNAATEFTVRFQEPDFSVVRSVLSGLDKDLKFTGPAQITGIEISIDFYPKEPGNEARALLHGVLIRHFFPTTAVLRTPRTWPRFNPGVVKDTDYTIGRNLEDVERDLTARMTPGMDTAPTYSATAYVGEKDDPRAFWRIQNKVIDRQNLGAGTHVDLPEQEKRVRIEVTLGESGCREVGLSNFDDLSKMPIARLQKKYFQFMKPTFAINPRGGTKSREVVSRAVEEFRRERFLNAGVLGLQIREDAIVQRLKEIRRRLKRIHRINGTRRPLVERRGTGAYGTMIAYEELSRIVERALSDLQRRVRKEMKG